MYDNGYSQVFTDLGLEKFANPVARWLAQKAPGFVKSVGSNMIGHPIRAYHQLRAGTLFGNRGLVREGLHAPGVLNKALMYGIPAAMGAYTLAGNDPDKYEQIGGLAGSTLAAGAVFGPLGMVGAMGALPLGTSVGRHVGGAIRNLATGEPSQASEAHPKPLHELPHPFAGPKPYPAVQYGQMAGLLGAGGGF